MVRFTWLAAAASKLLPVVMFVQAIDQQQQRLVVGDGIRDACPDYAKYSRYEHGPYSDGILKLPFQRPDPRCRTFHSDEIERVIKDVTSRMTDPDLARLFENAFPSTTDTTVKFHTDGTKTGFMEDMARRFAFGELDKDEGRWAGPQSFIITGDIVAEWLRDSTNQLAPYQALAGKDPAIATLIRGAIATQAEFIIRAPYCNAFQPPPISGLSDTANGYDDVVHPAYEPSEVFECKYELDSLAHFLAIGNRYYAHTTDRGFVNTRWLRALGQLLDVLKQQSRSTFDPDTESFVPNEYTFERKTTTGTETLVLGGIGNPLNWGTGLVRSAFRPSDDATILGFFIPANAMMAVELERTAKLLRDDGREELADRVAEWGSTIRAGVLEHGVVSHPRHGDVFAYEVDGYGSAILMDDANLPSLLALPLLGFVKADDPIYVNTRKMLLAKASNPYYLKGRDFEGIGGPHAGLQNAWPMSVLVQARTSNDDDEIKTCLRRVLEVSKLGLVHESVRVDAARSYTRSWFAWANGVFAETILDIANRKPHLIFDKNEPYEM